MRLRNKKNDFFLNENGCTGKVENLKSSQERRKTQFRAISTVLFCHLSNLKKRPEMNEHIARPFAAIPKYLLFVVNGIISLALLSIFNVFFSSSFTSCDAIE